MKRTLSLVLAILCIFTSLPGASAAETNGFSQVRATISATPSVTVEQSVVDASITFTQVPTQTEVTLRWYMGDTLCGEVFHFQLTEGATAELSCSVHFGDSTTGSIGLWVEITDTQNSDNIARFTKRILIRDFVQPTASPASDQYQIHVLRNQSVVIVYEKDANGEYTQVVNAFVCSPGKYEWTITGRYTTSNKWDWLGLMGGVAGQYTTQIWGDWLFHTVPYTGKQKHLLQYEEYNKLGEKASAGCIRMAVCDAKWIYDHCPKGTSVRIYDSDTIPLEKPMPIRINTDSPNKGWDPTDPDSANPTKADAYPVYTGTMIPVVTSNETTKCA